MTSIFPTAIKNRSLYMTVVVAVGRYECDEWHLCLVEVLYLRATRCGDRWRMIEGSHSRITKIHTQGEPKWARAIIF